jgi:nitrogen regulatory protein PII-like uncharacterized protein
MGHPESWRGMLLEHDRNSVINLLQRESNHC